MKDTLERIAYLKYKIKTLTEDIKESMDLKEFFTTELERLEGSIKNEEKI